MCQTWSLQRQTKWRPMRWASSSDTSIFEHNQHSVALIKHLINTTLQEMIEHLINNYLEIDGTWLWTQIFGGQYLGNNHPNRLSDFWGGSTTNQKSMFWRPMLWALSSASSFTTSFASSLPAWSPSLCWLCWCDCWNVASSWPPGAEWSPE